MELKALTKAPAPWTYYPQHNCVGDSSGMMVCKLSIISPIDGELIASAPGLADKVKALELQIDEIRKAWDMIDGWVGCETRSDPVADKEIQDGVEAMIKALNPRTNKPNDDRTFTQLTGAQQGKLTCGCAGFFRCKAHAVKRIQEPPKYERGDDVSDDAMRG